MTSFTMNVDRAVIMEEMQYDEYCQYMYRNDKHFADVMIKGKSEVLKRRSEREKGERRELLLRSNVADSAQHHQISSTRELHEVIAEAEEELYVRYDNNADAFFSKVAILASQQATMRANNQWGNDKHIDMQRYLTSYNKIIEEYDATTWIPSFLSPDFEQIDPIVVEADRREWNIIQRRLEYTIDNTHLKELAKVKT